MHAPPVSEKYQGEKFKGVDSLFYKVPPYNILDASSIKEGGPAPISYEKREVVADDDDLPVGQLLERPVSELRQDLSGKQCLLFLFLLGNPISAPFFLGHLHVHLLI